jgi:cation-transporting ATPase 13A1
MNKVKVSVYESRPGVEVPVPQLLGKKKGPRTFRLGLQHLPLFILYVFVLRWCLATAGQPYQTALREYEATHGNGTLGVGALGVAGGPSVVRKSDGVDFGADAFDAWGTDDFVATGEGEDQERFEEEEEEEEEGSERVLNNTPEDLNNGTAASWDDGWEEDEGPQLPSSFLPDFWAVFALLVTILSHALLELSQHWSIDFKTFVQYKRVPHFKEGAYVKVVPRDPHSTAEIVRVEQSTKYKVKGSPVLWFSSHKRKYEVVDNQIKKVQMPKKLTVQEYVSSNGYTGGDAILIAEERFGPNKFEIPMPTFSDLYIRQILSPMSVFQVFCVGLWLLDSAWKYALFGLFSVFGFEATSVVTRLKNIQMIRGMGNISQDIYVYRMGKWIKTSTEALLPGDIVSIKRLNTSSGEVVPCDCLLLSGRAIMNEATLTGESVPQMKEAVSSDQSSWGRQLDIKGSDKIHVLFGGTSILQQSPGANESSKFETPDGGCACYVLRTGFSSSQGKLVRMIELSSSGSQASNKDFLKESVYMICLLLIFAIFASSYVLQKGFEDKNRTRYELLIHCILIVTSVVPADLPMQLAIAVNASLIHLVRINIFCTEPFRVPLAGKIDSCFFDKTGTITTDQLEATGIVPPKLDEASSSNSGSSSGAATGEKVPMISAPLESCRVIAGCHSLLQVEGKTLGDPVESAALKSIGWEYNQDSQKASPAKSEESRSYSSYESVRIIHRYHFSSKLQRMSTVVHVDSPGPSSGYLVCTKGSPEMIATLLAEDGGSKPKWYDATYQKLAREGMRVIALAYREVTTLDDGKAIDAGCEKSVVKAPRSWAEANLKFAGFVAFRCLMRKDSKEVIDLLLKSDHHVAMITGDNILTALHVACDVGLSEKKREDILLLEKMESEPYLQWISSATEAAVCDFELSKVESLAKDHDLCITGKTLEHAFTLQGDKLGSVLQYFKVFARMAPENKEKVLSCLNNLKRTTLMCGDGANDVGALRQAHVGVALLSGFGSLNADRENKDKKDGDKAIEKKEEKDESDGKELGFFERFQKQMEEAQEKTKKLQEERSKRMEVMKDRKEKNQIKVKERKEKMMKDVEEETRRLIAEGHNSFTASVRAMKNVVKKHQEEGKQKVADAGGSFAFSAAALAAREDGLEEGELPMLKLGDASIAAPFTSKFPSIRSVYDIIRQGRCTLVTSVQNNQIMCLTSLISSYSLSVLYLDGIKFSDYQMTATGILLTASHLSVSHVKPLKKISAIRPLTSMFHPALFLSLLGQFAIHLTCMIIAVRDAKAYMDPNFKQEMHGKFEANLINTTVFFIETMQQVSVLMVNYKGRPFQPGLDENKPLLHSLGMSCIGLFVLAYELFPPINNLLELYSFPSDAFRWKMITILAFDVIGALVWDRLMHAIFARKLFIASQNQADFTTVARGCFKVLASTLSMYLLFNGSGMMGLGLIFFLYRNGFF